jgi:phosphatidylglycerol:prolipoprotein diacylglycerol transferase
LYPILFQWGDFSLPSWHVLYVVGALAAYSLMSLLRNRIAQGIKPGDLSQLFVVCYISGYFGARLLSVIVEEPHVSGVWETAHALIRFGPMTFYGGAISAFCAGSLFCLFRKIPYGDMIDLGLVAGLLGLSIGRVGCFLNGDDYGRPVPIGEGSIFSRFGVIFPVLEDGIPRWPVQLFEAIAVLVVVLVMVNVKLRKRARSGMVGLLCVILYANLRFCFEFLRDDFRGFVFGTWLSTSQFIALITLTIAGFISLFWLSKPTADQ